MTTHNIRLIIHKRIEITIIYYETDVSYDSFIWNKTRWKVELCYLAIITDDNYFC